MRWHSVRFCEAMDHATAKNGRKASGLPDRKRRDAKGAKDPSYITRYSGAKTRSALPGMAPKPG